VSPLFGELVGLIQEDLTAQAVGGVAGQIAISENPPEELCLIA
jgi:hypothetical protein